jgi:hypothetical protein
MRKMRRFSLAGQLELVPLFLDLPEQARVLHGDRRLGGEGLEQVDDVRRDRRPAHTVVRGQGPDRPSAGDHGDDEEALDAQTGELGIGRAQAIRLR